MMFGRRLCTLTRWHTAVVAAERGAGVHGRVARAQREARGVRGLARARAAEDERDVRHQSGPR